MTYTVGSVQQSVIKFLTTSGLELLEPWWTTCYGDIYGMIDFHYRDLAQAQQLAAAQEAQLRANVNAYYAENMAMSYTNSSVSAAPSASNGSQGFARGTDQFGQQYLADPNTAYGFLNPNNLSGIAVPDISEAESYYSIVALSTRQIMGAYVLAVPPTGSCSGGNKSEPLMFQKEISSNGNMNTVDVIFPAMPFFLYSNPALLKFVLEPLLMNQENGFYPNQYSMHDLGTHYPNATGHLDGDDEYMVSSVREQRLI